ncbi:hypothetical protein HUJ05_009468 [Dendroctonus ponderosae]|nr:hypothetical protein HUJ05_009468 [Dendroctonus ponderosae]
MKLGNYFFYSLFLFIQCSFGRRANDRNRQIFQLKEENMYLNENELIDSLQTGRRERHKIRHQHEEIHWPVKKIAIVEGDIVLGGLMMVHEREDSVMCGPVMPQGGIQALEAMLYTLDRLNNDEPKLLPDISIGAHILDDCDRDTYGLEMALDFIKGT